MEEAISTTVRHDIESTLSSRVAPAESNARSVENNVKSAGSRLWSLVRRHPYLGVAGGTALGIVAAASLGVGELAVGLAFGWAAFNVLRGGEKPAMAAKQVVEELEHL